MAQQGNRLRCHNTPSLAKPCDLRFLPHCLLYLHIMRKSKRSIGVMKSIPTWTNFLFLVGVSGILFFIQRRPTSEYSASAALSFWPSRIVLSAMYRFQSCHLDTRSLMQVMQQSIRQSHCSALAPCLLLMLMDWAISQTHSLTLLCFHRVVKPPFSCQIPMVSAAYRLTPTPAFTAQRQTCWVRIWIVLPSATTDFGNQKALHYNFGSQWWSMIQWWVSNARYIKQASGVLNISSRVLWCGIRGE